MHIRSTRLRQVALAIAGAAVIGSGANAAAPADAQAGWGFQPTQKQADYHITRAQVSGTGRFVFTLRNSGGWTNTYSWVSVRDPYGRVIAWYGKTGMDGGTEYHDGGHFPMAAKVCADDYQTQYNGYYGLGDIYESNEANNCTNVSPLLN